MSANIDTAGRGSVEPFKIPTVNIPDNAEASDYSLSFEIVTDAGMVVVSMSFKTYEHVSCTGSAKALIAAGLISPEWLVGGQKSWCITFDEHSGPSVRIGGRGRPKGRYMSIDTYCDPGMYRLRWDTTRLEQDKYARCVDDLSRSGKLQQRNESTDKAAFGKPTTPWTPDQARAKYNYIIEGTIGVLGRALI